jgi:hypothetical protein
MQTGHWRDHVIHRLNSGSDRTRAAVALYHASIAYAHEELTDGWVSPSFPTLAGFGRPHTKVLVDHGLWIPNEIVPDLGGWLIANYRKYQPSRDEWLEVGTKRKAAARARWHKEQP